MSDNNIDEVVSCTSQHIIFSYMTTESFIQRASENHDCFGNKFSDQYDYEEVIKQYPIKLKQTNLIQVRCKTHGIFFTRMVHHLYHSSGCQQCAFEFKQKKSCLSTTEYIESVLKKFPQNRELFDYTETVYSKSNATITFTCKRCWRKHEQRASNHLAISKTCECMKSNSDKQLIIL